MFGHNYMLIGVGKEKGFEGEVLFQNEATLNANIDKFINKLSKNKLILMLKAAKSNYVSGDEFNMFDILLKDLLSNELSTAYRQVKFEYRLPSESGFHNKDAKQSLIDLLSGGGDTSHGSLKYFIAAEITSCKIASGNNKACKALVDLVLFRLAKPINQNRYAEMERQTDAIFRL